MKHRVTFRREGRLSGLAGVSQGVRGFDINVDGKQIGTVSAVDKNNFHNTRWYWYVGTEADLGISWRNTHAENMTFGSADEAKDDVKIWLEARMK